MLKPSFFHKTGMRESHSAKLNGDLVCSISDKRDAFDFHVVNFSGLSGNIPTAPAYGTYISHLISAVGLAIITTTFLLIILCLQIDISTRIFLRN